MSGGGADGQDQARVRRDGNRRQCAQHTETADRSRSEMRIQLSQLGQLRAPQINFNQFGAEMGKI